MTRVALILRHGPGSQLGMREMVDMALVLATFDCPVSVVLQDDGVFWSTGPQFHEADPLSLKGRLKSLPLYDIETILIHAESLKARQVKPVSDFPGQISTQRDIAAQLALVDCILEA